MTSTLYAVALHIFLLGTALSTTSVFTRQAAPHDELRHARRMYVDGELGPESLAFDPSNRGPYTGVASGRILRWNGRDSRDWVEFAVTSSQRNECSLPYNPEMEHICGRPLGLRLNQKTGDLYIADAYLGLQVVGPKGGLAKPLVTEVEGQPLRLTNDVDIDEQRNVLYFTDSSLRFYRREFRQAFETMDKTGRLMKYDISSNKVTVLLRGLAFANGVSLSKDRSFVLVAETTARRILRYWLQGPNAGKHDIFAKLPGLPDNIRTNSEGNFWVALVLTTPTLAQWKTTSESLSRNVSWKLSPTSDQTNFSSLRLDAQAIAIKLSKEGKVLRVLKDVEGKTLRFIGEVVERNGTLWIGSALVPFIGKYTLKKP